MTKAKKSKNQGKEKQEIRGIEEDLRRSQADESIVVEEDMEFKERTARTQTLDKGETSERQLYKYRGIYLFYKKFVSKLKKVLK